MEANAIPSEDMRTVCLKLLELLRDPEAKPEWVDGVAGFAAHANRLTEKIDRLEAENSELRKDKSRLGFSVSYEFDDRSTAERLGMSAEAIRQQEDAIRNFAFYVANCTPLEGMSVAIQTFAPNEDQPANGK